MNSTFHVNRFAWTLPICELWFMWTHTRFPNKQQQSKCKQLTNIRPSFACAIRFKCDLRKQSVTVSIICPWLRFDNTITLYTSSIWGANIEPHEGYVTMLNAMSFHYLPLPNKRTHRYHKILNLLPRSNLNIYLTLETLTQHK